MGTRVFGGVALALALSACGGRIVPPSTYSAPVRGVDREARASTVRPAPARVASTGSAVRSGRSFDGGIVAAVPMLPQPVVSVPETMTAAAAGVVPGPDIDALGITEAQAAAARSAFAASCSSLLRRPDVSGLTRNADWQPACDAARSGSGSARDFFRRYLEAVQVGDGRLFATGYYEPEIRASRERRAGFGVPIYARPSDLIDVDLGQFYASLKGKKIRGRVRGTALVPYDDRAAIEQGSLGERASVLAWGADPVEVFFLQIQGSGRLRLPDGSFMRVGYDSQNGRDYTGIGALMKARGLLGPGQTSMQGIVTWLHAHPDEGQAIMRENRSFVFFRELDGPPLGALGYPVSGGVSVAADPKFVPLGAPVFLSADRADAAGLWVAQDTGGAIKGANRVDTFWGAGAAAERTAGGMSAHGTAFLLLPVGTSARLGAAGTGQDAVAQP